MRVFNKLIVRSASTENRLLSFYCCRCMSTVNASPPSVEDRLRMHLEQKRMEIDPLEKQKESDSIYKLGRHRSNAMELVHQYPVIEVDGERAICDGGGGALGHPLEYISLKVPGTVEYCKYCALRFTKKKKE